MLNNVQDDSFARLFNKATGDGPFAFQRRFAKEIPSLVCIPTGLGKTAMVVIGWLWRRFGASNDIRLHTPRRLVYCLPMRVLVEQTRDNVVLWLHNLNLLAGQAEFDNTTPKPKLKKYTPSFDAPGKVAVHILMGGEDEDDWDIHPDRETIIIGTQDMLLSRALNRGYAASRSRWPIQFGLLHTDCLWVFDEIQLMGAGLATTAQLEAFRRMLPNRDNTQAKNGHGCRSVWMSATMQKDWLKTVDLSPCIAGLTKLDLTDEDLRNKEVKKRWEAAKHLKCADAQIGDAAGLAAEICREHKAGTRTIVVVNTVRRACELFNALTTVGNGGKVKGGKGANQRDLQDSGATAASAPKPRIVLLHSRFRPPDREAKVREALADIQPNDPGMIVVSTQVIEAGVDVSATTLFTELAPWASLVQRFGRCNRKGEANEHAAVWWIDLPTKKPGGFELLYGLDKLQSARERLTTLNDVGLKSLPAVDLPFNHAHVIRRKDLVDLFDTTPDLAGNDIDIDRFVREIEDSDVRIFWRAWNQPNGHEAPPGDEPAPHRDELCPARVGEFRAFTKKHGGKVWRWDFLDKKWEKANDSAVSPGQVFLVYAGAGGYTSDRGWAHDSSVEAKPLGKGVESPDATDNDRSSQGYWQSIDQHANDLCQTMDAMLNALPLAEAESLRHAARWHDRGKAHDIFQSALPAGAPQTGMFWAKARGSWSKYARRHFRHELASALAVLDPKNQGVPDDLRDLVAYLVAAHHGKVRLSIRSLPNEKRPDPRQDDGGRERRFARGVWDGDTLPQTGLGGGVIAPAVTLSLEPMELGLCQQEPFIGQPSWAERMIRLRNTIGPFRLAYLEAILRAADMRASKKTGQQAAIPEEAGHD